MGKQHVYTVDKEGKDRWLVTKLDRRLLFEDGFYRVSRTPRNEWLCDCPAAHLTSCRHREIVHVFTKAKKVGKGRLYDYDKHLWMDKYGKR